MLKNEYLKRVLTDLEKRSAGEKEFLQAVTEVLESLEPVIEADPRYEQNGVIDGTGTPAPPAPAGGYKGEYAEEIITLDRLAKKLRAKRFKNGAVKFDSEEMRFEIDDEGKPVRCYFKRSKDANKLIEEFIFFPPCFLCNYFPIFCMRQDKIRLCLHCMLFRSTFRP